jgi:hypothetical protein
MWTAFKHFVLQHLDIALTAVFTVCVCNSSGQISQDRVAGCSLKGQLQETANRKKYIFRSSVIQNFSLSTVLSPAKCASKQLVSGLLGVA